MFNARAEDIERLRSPGGDRFASFVNDVIFAHALATGIPAPAVHLNLQTNVGDGGVDAEVSAAGNDPMGWLAEPSVWQFKASQAADAGPKILVEDINKDFAARRVREGYAYYACICDHLSQKERSRREDALLKAARTINPAASAPHVLDANDLATLASRYPAVVLRHFRPEAEGWCLSLNAWRPNAVGSTAHYVLSPELEEAGARIEAHLTFATTPRDAVLVLRGESGVGKTRLAFEAIRRAPGAETLAVFAVDEAAASRLATLVANASLSAILVADETTARAIAQLRAILDGHRDRVRVVAIESTEEEYRRDDGEAIWLNEVSNLTLDKILDENFPEVSRERRRAYAHLAGGSIRFAVELCRRDAEIALEPSIPRAAFARDYVARLLTDHEKDAVEAVALVYGVGWRDEVADELQRLCALLGLDAGHVRRSAVRVHEAPGFIGIAGRYWYVKPPIVARVAFEDAWRRWAAHGEQAFLEGFAAGGLLKPFLRQVGRVASNEVRRRAGEFSRGWAEGLAPESLGRREDVAQLLDLVEVDPDTYFPVFRRLVERAPNEVLASGTSWDPEHREARYELVKVARRFANFPEHFHDAESVLLRLALAETAPRISPSAIGTYKQLFKVVMSGTVLPFGTRLPVLSRRIREGDEPASLLAVDALCAVFDRTHSRGVDDPLVAGRIASDDWWPETYVEWHDCLAAAVEEVRAAVLDGSDAVRDRTWVGLLPRLEALADEGFAAVIPTLFPAEHLPATIRERAVVELGAYLESLDDAADEDERRRRISTEDEQELRDFVDALKPGGLQERLAVALAADYWRAKALDPGSAWRSEVRALAAELVRNPAEFAVVKDRLFSPTLSLGHEFGLELGGQDHDGALLGAVLGTALDLPFSNFSLGYVKGMAEQTSAHADRIGRFLDEAEERAPLLAFYLAPNAGEDRRALERMLRLVDDGRVPVVHLSTLATGLKGRRLDDEEFEQVLERFATGAEHQEMEAAVWGIRLLHLRLSDQTAGVNRGEKLRRGHVASLAWRLVEAMATAADGESSSWAEIFEDLAPTDPVRAATVGANALASGNRAFRAAATQALVEVAAAEPSLVMGELGRVMLDPELVFSFGLHSHTSVFEALPPAVVEAWLDRTGSEGAIELAWHLPHPYLVAPHQAGVPALTEIVLTRFGQDQEVFDRFCRASISDTRYEAEELQAGLTRRRTIAELARAFETHPNPHIRNWVREIHRRVDEYGQWVADTEQEDEERRFK